jgi:hypothetical protein
MSVAECRLDVIGPGQRLARRGIPALAAPQLQPPGFPERFADGPGQYDNERAHGRLPG